jgi:GNAT superfamily N-acetyltransferase
VTTQIEVRLARADDRDALLGFCQNTFSWGDYIAEVWDAWLTDAQGQLLVGLLDQQAVGLLHLAFLESGAAWMEGMRVHPDFRRRGVGSALDSAARTRARERGAVLARLVTSSKNVAAQKTLATEGYACIAHFTEWEAKPARRKFSAARIATPSQGDELLNLWDASLGGVANGLLPDRHWHWDPLTRARLSGEIDAGKVRIAGGGFAFLPASDGNDSNGISLQSLAGSAQAMLTLALAARGEAHYRGYPRVEAILIDHPQVNSALESAGFVRQGGMLVYEQTL